LGRYLALLLALMLGSWIAFADQLLPDSVPAGAPATEFSADRAFSDVSLMGTTPHPVGSPANTRIRDAIVARMTELGLEAQVRPGVGVSTKHAASGRLVAGPVDNIIGVLPGRDRGKPAIGLMAHYDSVPGSPGAADNIMGVATALETVRAIKARGTPARDVMLIMTDGEETGLLGANHFYRRDPVARRLGLVLNLEARGSSGRVQMFQTSPDNGELIRLFQSTAQRPFASSLSALVFGVMPNDTDLTEALAVGLPGLNYAITGRAFDYHAPTATPENLERGSLQDMGTQALSLASEAAFAAELPGPSPSPIYANLFGDIVIAYPVWLGWSLIMVILVLLAFAVRWARHSGEFPAIDILHGAGALAFGAIGSVAAIQFARHLTGAEFGFLEQRFLLAHVVPWEWAIMLISLGFMMLAAGDLARGRRWMAAVPLALGLGCSAFGGFDPIGAISGVVAAILGWFVYRRRTGRKGAWAGVLLLTLALAILLQAFAPAASFVLVWPLLIAALGAAATSMSARRGVLPLLALVILASLALGWEGGISHAAFEAVDFMPIFGLQMVTAGVVLWPLAQPDSGAQKGLVVGMILLFGGFALTAFIRSEEPWSPRYPQISYVGYQVDQDTRKAWVFSPPVDKSGWTLRVLGPEARDLNHWAWTEPMRAVDAAFVEAPAPTINLTRLANGSLRLTAQTPPGARTLTLRLRTATPSRVTALSGLPVAMNLPPSQWTRVDWVAPGNGLSLDIRPTGPGRIEVRYTSGFDAWPTGVERLPTRPADVMPWDNSDSTFVSGTRAFAW
jgi:hypothetical protein